MAKEESIPSTSNVGRASQPGQPSLNSAVSPGPDPSLADTPTLPPVAPSPSATLPTVRPSPGSSLTPEATRHDSEPSPIILPSVPGYDILAELGRGGMGVVYQARQAGLNRLVALKMILAGGHAGPEALARFRSEAQAVARLQHPNIVQIYEIGEHEGRPFFSMEFCPGGSLDRKLRGNPMPPAEATRLIETLARAMHAAHQAHVIHRDLKPANVLLTTDGTPKITDFGLAKKLDEASQSHTGEVMGTPSYMAPEQASGDKKQIGATTDVYALGAMLYECLTGRPPFKAATSMDTMLQVLTNEAVPVRQLQPATPRDLETICLKCLQKSLGKRYVSSLGLAEDLRRYLAGEPITARPIGRLERGLRWVGRNPLAAGLTMLLFLALTAGLVISTTFGIVARNEAHAARNREYDATLLLAQNAWEQFKVLHFLDLLEGQKPRSDQEDLRGFEWHYWKKQARRGHITLTGHTMPVLSVAFSPDGKRIASGGFDRTVRLWWTANGQQSMVLNLPTVVHSIAFSPDGRHLASGEATGELKLWHATTGQQVSTVKAHSGPVKSLAFSPDGKRLASAAETNWSRAEIPGEVKVWNPATGQQLLSLKRHALGAAGVAFSPDGKRLASAGGGADYGIVRIWNTENGQELSTLKGHTGAVFSITFCADGKRLASGSIDGTVKLWDTVTGQETFTWKGHTDAVSSVMFTPDSRRLASAGYDAMVKIWDPVAGQETLALRGHTQKVTSLALSPDGSQLASASDDATVKLWDAESGQEVRPLKGHTEVVLNVAFSTDGKRLASASRDGTVKLWEVEHGREVRSFSVGPVSHVGFSADGTLLVSKGPDGKVKVWEASGGREVFTLTQQAEEFCAALSSKGDRLLLASSDVLDRKPPEVKVWNTAGAQQVFSLDGHTKRVTSAAFSGASRRIATVSDGTVKLWDASNGKEIRTLKGQPAETVLRIAFCPTNNNLVTCQLRTVKMGGDLYGQTRELKLWDSDNGQEILAFKGDTCPIHGIVYTPDGKRLASAGEDGVVKLWNAATGQELLSIKAHVGMVTSVAFSPDGKRLASAGTDTIVKIWDADSGEWPSDAKGKATASGGIPAAD